MNYIIREMVKSEYPLLEDFLYNAIFIPQGAVLPSQNIIDRAELQVYIEEFGSRSSDTALVAEVDGKVIGAVWARIMDDYGHIDNDTPSLAISLFKEYRGNGIGTDLMRKILQKLRCKGYKNVSLSVQKANYAVRMYLGLGFQVIEENAEEYIMKKSL